MRKELIETAAGILDSIRCENPLIHYITNYVTVNDCANITLAIGASPIMADDIREVKDIVSIASALVLNTGTLDKRTEESMIIAGKAANSKNIPVIFDPAGAGASKLRSESAKFILDEIKISIVRGNISEIRSLAGLDASVKGVDASGSDIQKSLAEGCSVARSVSERFSCITAITGAADILSDGKSTFLLENGSRLLTRITGAGCMCTSLIGSFCAASEDQFAAAAGAILSMGIAGETAAENAGETGSGSFHAALINAVSQMNPSVIRERGNIREA